MGSCRAPRARSYVTGGLFPITLQLWVWEQGKTSAFHKANCRTSSQHGEVRKQKEPGRKAARLLPSVQEEPSEEAKLHRRHGTSSGGCAETRRSLISGTQTQP